AGLADIALQHGHPLLLGGAEGADVVLDAPVEGVAVDVEADGGVGRPAADPLATGGRGAAEILAEASGPPAAEFAEGVVDEVDLGLDVLDGELIEDVAVGGGGGELAAPLPAWSGGCCTHSPHGTASGGPGARRDG